ncbi:AAA family ATPase [Sphingomonas panni]
MTAGSTRATSFISTQEHRRFIRVRRRCSGSIATSACVMAQRASARPLSACRYARWHKAAPLLTVWGPRDPSDLEIYAHLAQARAVFYTPSVGSTLRELRQDLPWLLDRVDHCIDEHVRPQKVGQVRYVSRHTRYVEMVIVDEAERLSTTALEYMRDVFDRQGIGLILIGMPGIEKRMARYPQLFSRVGFAHQYRPLQDAELTFVLTRRWRDLGLALDDRRFHRRASGSRPSFGSQVAISRLLHRLFVQIERVLKINGLATISEDVVEAARSTLVIGVT